MNEKIKQAAKLIKQGKLVSFPTETVYALAADANNSKAVEAIYRLKGRNADKPLALLLADIDLAQSIVELNEAARKLAAEFCPGPITFVLKKHKGSKLAANLNEGIDTIAVRIPDHEIALSILRKAGCPVVATSVNPSGQPSAISAAEVEGYFSGRIDYLLDGGDCTIGIASTVVDLTGSSPKILREGSITKEDIESVLEDEKN